MAHIQYYFSTISVFAYLAGNRLEEISARHGVQVVYKPFDIVALLPRTGGTPVAERHPSRLEYRLQELDRQAAKTGMALKKNPMHWPTNAAPSSYAIIAAQAAANGGASGDVGALVQGIMAACWVEERDIAQDEVIGACLENAGFDPNLANSGMLAGAETYARNLEEAVAQGVFGSPFYITETGARFWGQDRLEDLDAHLSGKL
ncbi:MAG: 2-hydroxychromene-2-carboxylate isomerase [Rhodobacteraceae bacterium]|nr:2-hydroxychromene-2-carboxylate isomerase [Paracoccaceae bacterium]